MKKTKIFLLLIAMLFAIAFTACGGGGGGGSNNNNSPGSGSTSNVIGSEGGTYTSPDGITITIPPGALTEQITLTVDRYADTASLPIPVVGGFGFAGGARFAPNGLTFNKPVTIRLPLTSSFPSGTRLPLFYFTNSPPSWRQTPFVGVVDTSGSVLVANITHFSTFTVFYSQRQGMALGLFDSFIDNFGETSVIAEVDKVAEKFSNLFPIDGRVIHDFRSNSGNPDAANIQYPDWWPLVPPEASNPPGYHCYETIGMNIVLLHDYGTLYENPIVREYGQTGNADVHMVYSSVRDRQTREGDEERQYLGEVYVSLLLRAVPPTMELIPTRRHIGFDQSTGLTLSLSCNGEPMVDQEINFALLAPILGSLAPFTVNTNQAGVGEAVFTATTPTGGAQQISAAYRCCVGTEHPEDGYAITQVEIGEYVEIDPLRIHLLQGQSAVFTGTLRNGLGEDITQTPFLWSSSDQSLCSVNPNEGISTTVTAAGNVGTAIITAAEPETQISAISTVLVGATVEIDPLQQCIVKNPGVSVTRQLAATVKDPEGNTVNTYPLTWTSSNENVAVVDDTGNVAVIDNGVAQIQAKINYAGPGDYFATALLTMPKFPDELTVTDIVSEPYSLIGDLKLTNARNLVHLNNGEASVKNQIVVRAAENGWVMNPLDLHVVDVNVNDQALVTYTGGILLMDYNTASYTELTPPGSATPIAMNDHGDVLLGDEYDLLTIYIYKDGNFTTIGPPAPYSYIGGSDINNNGVVVGAVYNTSNSEGFVYKEGAFTLLPLSAMSINDDEQVILGYRTVYHQGTYYSFLPSLLLVDINNFSDMYVAEFAFPGDLVPKHSIYHLCPLP